jgi:hypothetical protein
MLDHSLLESAPWQERLIRSQPGVGVSCDEAGMARYVWDVHVLGMRDER